MLQRKERIMATINGPRINISVQYGPRDLDSIPLGRQESLSLDLSGLKSVGESELQKAIADHQILGAILREHRAEIGAILNDILAGRREEAKARAHAIGLTEEAFQRQSGGLIWLVAIAVAAGILLYPREAH